jgi:hypothetical protein
MRAVPGKGAHRLVERPRRVPLSRSDSFARAAPFSLMVSGAGSTLRSARAAAVASSTAWVSERFGMASGPPVAGVANEPGYECRKSVRAPRRSFQETRS